jgi:hypothetical protein
MRAWPGPCPLHDGQSEKSDLLWWRWARSAAWLDEDKNAAVLLRDVVPPSTIRSGNLGKSDGLRYVIRHADTVGDVGEPSISTIPTTYSSTLWLEGEGGRLLLLLLLLLSASVPAM